MCGKDVKKKVIGSDVFCPHFYIVVGGDVEDEVEGEVVFGDEPSPLSLSLSLSLSVDTGTGEFANFANFEVYYVCACVCVFDCMRVSFYVYVI